MSQAYETQSQLQPETKSSGGGKCLLYSCLGITLLVLVVCGGGSAWVYMFAKAQIAKYTSDVPADIPIVELDDETVEAIEARTTAFRETMENGGTPEPLVLTAEEINGMIGSNEEMRGRLFVRIENGNISGDVSIPTDFFPGGEGRFFNASGTFEVSIINGRLDVRLVDGMVKGEPIPPQIIEEFGRQNLAQDADRNNPEFASFMEHMESIRVEGDKVILVPKSDSLEVPEIQSTDENSEDAATENGEDAATETGDGTSTETGTQEATGTTESTGETESEDEGTASEDAAESTESENTGT